MKKVGIVTFQNANNFGAVLQAYATQKALEKMGYQVYIINYDNPIIGNNYKVFPPLSKNPLKSIRRIIISLGRIKPNIERIKSFDKFRNEYLNLTEPMRKNDILNRPPKYDVYVSGSDQIWNPKFTKNLDDIYTLNFGPESVKRIAYASSTGNAMESKNNDELYKQKLKMYDYISVREKSAATRLEKLLNTEIFTALDPSLLLDKNDWYELSKSIKEPNYKYILSYNPGGAKDLYFETINSIAKKTGYHVIYLDIGDKKNIVVDNKVSKYSASPDEFVSLVENAELVVTSSFHGLAFALNLNIKVMVVYGWIYDRLENLLNILDLKDIVVNDKEDIEKIYNKDINWDKVNKLLGKEREKCLKWLDDSLKNDGNANNK